MLSVISCSQPSENKVNTLIQESVKKSLSPSPILRVIWQ